MASMVHADFGPVAVGRTLTKLLSESEPEIMAKQARMSK